MKHLQLSLLAIAISVLLLAALMIHLEWDRFNPPDEPDGSMRPSVAGAGPHDLTVTALAVDVRYPDLVFVMVGGHPGSYRPASCASAEHYNYVLSVKSPWDQRVYDLLREASNSQARLNLVGAGTCDVHPQIETLQIVETLPYGPITEPAKKAGNSQPNLSHEEGPRGLWTASTHR